MREPWLLVYPQEALIGGITHRSCRWDANQKLTDCGIHYAGGDGIHEAKEKDLAESGVNCMACIAGRVVL